MRQFTISDLLRWLTLFPSRSDDKLGDDHVLARSHKRGSLGLEGSSEGLGRGTLSAVGNGEAG